MSVEEMVDLLQAKCRRAHTLSVDELVNLLNELAKCRQAELEARGWPDRRDEIFAMISAVYPHASGDTFAMVDRFGPHGMTSKGHMPLPKAREVVRIINDGHQHLDILIDAYIEGDQKRALDHIRELFATIREARKLGAPEKPYKAATLKPVLEWAGKCHNPPTQLKVRRAIKKALQGIGQSPSPATITNWVNEVLALDAQRRQKC